MDLANCHDVLGHGDFDDDGHCLHASQVRVACNKEMHGRQILFSNLSDQIEVIFSSSI